MKRFAVAISRQKGIKLPSGYATSGSICRAFLEQHAPKKAEISAQVSADDSNRPVRKRRRSKEATVAAPGHKRAARGKATRKPKFNGSTVNAQPGLSRHDVGGNTPLKIPYGNKEIALKLGARYAAGGWYAPPGVDLSAFKENGWL